MKYCIIIIFICLLIIISLIGAVVHLSINSMEKQEMDMVADNFNKWGIDTTTPNTTKHGWLNLLNSTVSSRFANKFRPDISLDCKEYMLKWTSAPYDPQGGNLYNPSVIHTPLSDGTRWVMFRNDNHVDTGWGDGTWRYSCILSHMLSSGDIYFDNMVHEIEFYNSDGITRMDIALSLRSSNEKSPVIEDLRALPYVSDGRPCIVTGVAVTSYGGKGGGSTKIAVFEAIFSSPRTTGDDLVVGDVDCSLKLRLVSYIDSPTDTNIEKNWQFIETPIKDHYSVFYDCVDGSIRNYKWKIGENVLTAMKTHELPYVSSWINDLARNGSSDFRHTSITHVPNTNEIMLLMHKRDVFKQIYTFYCLYVDETTHKPIAFIPGRVLADIGISVFFVMNVDITDKFVYVWSGIADQTGGVMTYDRTTWESRKQYF